MQLQTLDYSVVAIYGIFLLVLAEIAIMRSKEPRLINAVLVTRMAQISWAGKDSTIMTD